LSLKSLIKSLFSRAASPDAAEHSSANLLAEAAALLAAGQWDVAERKLRSVVAAEPRNAEAHLQLGMLLGHCDKLDEARLHLTVAIAENPRSPDAHNALGNIHLLKGELDSAERCYAAALKLNPGSAPTYLNLGLLAQSRFDHAAALAHFEKARQLAPAMPGLLKIVIVEKVELGQAAGAEALLRNLDVQDGRGAEYQYCLGYVLLHLQQPHAAVDYLERAKTAAPRDPEVLLQLGIALRETGEVDQAIAYFDRALAEDPGLNLAQWHKSLACLTVHDFSRGWQHYDLRLQSRDRPQRADTYPQWDARPAPAARVLVFGEQGPGDEIMFAACLPQLIASVDKCVVECSPKLVRLFSRSFPGAEVRAAATEVPAGGEDRFDAQIALGSLPKVWRRSGADFPEHCGYLRADVAKAAAWRQRLDGLGKGLKVGISWRGGTDKTRAYMRSIPLQQWGAILQVPGVHFIDLQYTDCGDEVTAAASAHGVTIHRWQEPREDLDEAAALVESLDLVISVCTTLIHLGGALGKPVWVLTPYSPEWRYGIRGERMPWYPSVRLFRQPGFGVWEPVMQGVAKSLRAQCESADRGDASA